MRFLIDAMYPPLTVNYLNVAGHDAISPLTLGYPSMPDALLIELATTEQRVIVTENASDFARVTGAPVLYVLKSWWPAQGLASRMAAAVDRWAASNPEPGHWPHWLEARFR